MSGPGGLGGLGGRALQSILVCPGDIGLQLPCKAIMLHCSAPQGDYTGSLARYCPPREREEEGKHINFYFIFSPNFYRYCRKMMETTASAPSLKSKIFATLSSLLVVVVPLEKANESDIRD